MIGPAATPEAPLTTIFQVRSSAPPSAFIGMTPRSALSGIATAAGRADARRVPGQVDRDRRLEARLPVARRPSGPSSRPGPAAPWARRSRSSKGTPRSRPPRAGRRPRSRTLTLFWPSTSSTAAGTREGTFSLGSAGLPVTLARAPASGASGLAEKSTGIRRLARRPSWSASTVTPGGQAVERSIVQLAAEVGASGVDQDRLPVPLGNGDGDHAGPAAGDLLGGDAQRRAAARPA